MGEGKSHDDRPVMPVGGVPPACPQVGYGSPPGGYGMIGSIAVGMAAGPFLAAVATHFGTKLAGVIDESVRAAVRRFLRREAALPAGAPDTSINLRTEHGWTVELHTNVPAEAIAQLLVIHKAEPPHLAAVPTPRLVWERMGWWLMGVEANAPTARPWDTAANRWGLPLGT